MHLYGSEKWQFHHFKSIFNGIYHNYMALTHYVTWSVSCISLLRHLSGTHAALFQGDRQEESNFSNKANLI